MSLSEQLVSNAGNAADVGSKVELNSTSTPDANMNNVLEKKKKITEKSADASADDEIVAVAAAPLKSARAVAVEVPTAAIAPILAYNADSSVEAVASVTSEGSVAATPAVAKIHSSSTPLTSDPSAKLTIIPKNNFEMLPLDSENDALAYSSPNISSITNNSSIVSGDLEMLQSTQDSQLDQVNSFDYINSSLSPPVVRNLSDNNTSANLTPVLLSKTKDLSTEATESNDSNALTPFTPPFTINHPHMILGKQGTFTFSKYLSPSTVQQISPTIKNAAPIMGKKLIMRQQPFNVNGGGATSNNTCKQILKVDMPDSVKKILYNNTSTDDESCEEERLRTFATMAMSSNNDVQLDDMKNMFSNDESDSSSNGNADIEKKTSFANLYNVGKGILNDNNNSTVFEALESDDNKDIESGLGDDEPPYLGGEGMERACKLCSLPLTSPRILSCLHVFCENCLSKLVADDSVKSSSSVSSDDSAVVQQALRIECPTCKQSTKVDNRGVDSLLCDYISTNIFDLSAIETQKISCTSCKSQKLAISRCNDCANFLCNGCDHAHQHMRCFENHKVIKLEDLQKNVGDKSLTIHKPLYCKSHKSEHLKYYCFSCQTPVCNDCLIADHKGSDHHYDVIGVAEISVRNDIENLMKEALSKMHYCDTAAATLTTSLNELQTQHDTARDLIEDTFKKYIKILESCRDGSLNELGRLHSERELKIMDLLQTIANTMDRIESTCQFTDRVLKLANATEFLSMKKLIGDQIVYLINKTPKCDVNFSLKFDTNIEKYESIAQTTFGSFRTESSPPSPKESTPPPTLPGVPPTLMSGAAANQGRGKAIPMQIRCKFGSLGTSKGQFNSPHGFCLGVDEEIIVADTNNHRIEVFDKTGTLKFQFGVPGKDEGQLWYPRKVAVMPQNGKFVVCDRGNERSRMQIFSKLGHFMRKIAIRYIDIVAGLAVTNKGHIVAVDSVSPTVFVISEDGDLVRWFDCSDHMREPSDIAIRGNDFYVCDFKGHCVAVFKEDGTFRRRIGNEKVTCFPNGIDISNDGDVLIGDSHGNRFHVACFSEDGSLLSEFECPHVKVSRCCGLKITSEGYVVTLAKNNHHVLMLNTLILQ